MSDDILTRLRDHVAAMMPYYRQRKAGKLLIEAAEEIEKLRGIILKNEEALREAACSEHQGRIERMKAALPL